MEHGGKAAAGGAKKDPRRGRRALAWCLAALAVAACLLVLWSRGAFCVADIQTSPDGSITTTAYYKNVSGPFPTDQGFTLRDRGRMEGTTSYLDGKFDGLWWSPNSKYQVVSMVTEEGVRLALADYVRNVGVNLDAYLERAIYGQPDFADVPDDGEGRPEIEYRFVQWSEVDPAAMLIRFSFTAVDGTDRSGYFWYSYETWEISGVTREPVTAISLDGEVYPLDVEELSISMASGIGRLGDAGVKRAELRQLRWCTNLRDLDLQNMPHDLTAEDLAFLAELPTLERLSAAYARDEAATALDTLDLSPLTQGRSVKSLFVDCGWVRPDVSALEELPELEKLYLAGCGYVKLERLEDCETLRELHLNGIQKGMGTGGLPPMAELEKLYVSQSEGVDWTGVAEMPRLSFLYASETDTLPDMELLAAHPSLNQLVVYWGADALESVDTVRWGDPTVLEDAEGEIPEWLPLPQEQVRAFLRKEDAALTILYR